MYILCFCRQRVLEAQDESIFFPLALVPWCNLTRAAYNKMDEYQDSIYSRKKSIAYSQVHKLLSDTHWRQTCLIGNWPDGQKIDMPNRKPTCLIKDPLPRGSDNNISWTPYTRNLLHFDFSNYFNLKSLIKKELSLYVVFYYSF